MITQPATQPRTPEEITLEAPGPSGLTDEPRTHDCASAGRRDEKGSAVADSPHHRPTEHFNDKNVVKIAFSFSPATKDTSPAKSLEERELLRQLTAVNTTADQASVALSTLEESMAFAKRTFSEAFTNNDVSIRQDSSEASADKVVVLPKGRKAWTEEQVSSALVCSNGELSLVGCPTP